MFVVFGGGWESGKSVNRSEEKGGSDCCLGVGVGGVEW